MNIWQFAIFILLLGVVIWLMFEIHVKLREACIRLAQIQADILSEGKVEVTAQDYSKNPVVVPTRTIFHDINDKLNGLTR